MGSLRIPKVLFLLSAILLSESGLAQDFDRVERDAAQTMLKDVSTDVSKRYFDSTLRGVAWVALVKKTQENINNAHDMEDAIAQIAGLLQSLHDSHTFFIPPPRANKIVYGWKFQIVGSQTFITEVSPKSDAENQGVHPGDEVLSINGFKVNRESSPLLHSALEQYLPLSSVDVKLRDRQGHERQLRLLTSVIEKPAVAGMTAWAPFQSWINAQNAWENLRAETAELSPDVIAIRVPAFLQTGHEVDALFAKARKYKKLIIDLRGCHGGRVTSVHEYLEHVFDHDVSIGKLIERGKETPQTIKGDPKKAFPGDLIVLVDSETASGGEIFARVVQLQKRGNVVGDHTSGLTMESVAIPHWTGMNPWYFYGASVTVADTVMADGKSVERNGVQPDQVFLPSPADLAAHRDHVLAFAASLMGVQLTSDQATKVFPPEKP